MKSSFVIYSFKLYNFSSSPIASSKTYTTPQGLENHRPHFWFLFWIKADSYISSTFQSSVSNLICAHITVVARFAINETLTSNHPRHDYIKLDFTALALEQYKTTGDFNAWSHTHTWVDHVSSFENCSVVGNDQFDSLVLYGQVHEKVSPLWVVA